MEEDADDEGEADAAPRILQCVESSEGKWLVDGDEPVDRNADVDEHRADRERIGHGQHEMSLSQSMMIDASRLKYRQDGKPRRGRCCSCLAQAVHSSRQRRPGRQ